ncbi:MAG: tyrosine-type recombinase/integrase [Dermatophilaceae bacterium]
MSQSYRLLRAVLNVAVEDGAILRNPCHILGAGSVRASERGIATPAQVAALVEAVTPRYRAAVVLAAWCGLRGGEICAIRTEDVDVQGGIVHVSRYWVELLESPVKFEKEPKSDAGKRTVSVPPHVLPVLREHALPFAGPEFFTVGRDGRRASGNTVYQAFVRARRRVGVDIAFS